MSTTKVGPKRQVTIPRDVLEKLRLEVGDILEAEARRGKIVLVPKKTGEKISLQKLAPRDQTLLARARRKIARLQRDLASARGLTSEEADAAVRARLIPSDQRWWWTEQWQRGEREVESDLRAGRTKTYGSAGELLQDLRTR